MERTWTKFYRGDIVFVDTPPTVGSEQGGARFGVIVSNAACNHHSPVLELVYLTTKTKQPLPTHVIITSSPRRSTVLCEQVDSVDRRRLRQTGRRCSIQEMQDINRGLTISLGLIETW